jgi:predicted SAM-dependent methyltransferase
MPLAINVGSGQRPFSDSEGWTWINVDTNPKWFPDLVADAANMPDLSTQSADVVVLHHMLEHFGLDGGAPVIQECMRVLKPGGKLIVCVPDMRALAQGWLAERLDDYQFFVNVYGAYMGDEADRHKWGYTMTSLSRLLLANGCLAVRRLTEAPQLPGADIAMDWWILAVEGVK